MENLSNKSIQEQISELENQKIEAAAVFDGETEGKLQEKINELKKTLETTVEQAVITPEYQEKQIEDLGGTKEELNKRTAEIDQAIEKEKVKIQNENISNKENVNFLIDKLKMEKFEKLEENFLKFYEEKKTPEYNLSNLSKQFGIYDQIGPNELSLLNSQIESIPKVIIEEMINSTDPSVDAWQVKNSILMWKNSVGQKIGQMSSDRDRYYDSSKNAIVENGIPKNATQYLEVVSNAARFVPKEISEKFIKDAISAFIDKDKNDSVNGGNRFIQATGRLYDTSTELNVLRNLIESGYKEDAKQLMGASLEKYGKNVVDKVFELEKLNLFSREEITKMIENAGLLDEPKLPENTNGWG